MAKELVPVDLEDSVPDNTVGGLPDIDDDNYLFEVETFESDVDADDRRYYRIVAFIVNDCKYKGTTFKEKFTFPADSEDDFSKKGRDRFHAWLLSIGYDTSKRKFGLDPDKIHGKRFWSRTYHHKMPASADGRFEEREYSRLGPFSPDKNEDAEKRLGSRLPARASTDGDEDEAPKKRGVEKEVLKKKRQPEPEPEEEEEDEDEEEEEKRPARRTKAEPSRKGRAKDEDDDEEEDEDEEEEDEAPPAKKKAVGKKAAKEEQDDEEEDDEDEEDIFPSRPLKGKKDKAVVPKAVARGGSKKRATDDDDDDE